MSDLLAPCSPDAGSRKAINAGAGAKDALIKFHAARMVMEENKG